MIRKIANNEVLSVFKEEITSCLYTLSKMFAMLETKY